jgi:hypothetical protein
VAAWVWYRVVGVSARIGPAPSIVRPSQSAAAHRAALRWSPPVCASCSVVVCGRYGHFVCGCVGSHGIGGHVVCAWLCVISAHLAFGTLRSM